MKYILSFLVVNFLMSKIYAQKNNDFSRNQISIGISGSELHNGLFYIAEFNKYYLRNKNLVFEFGSGLSYHRNINESKVDFNKRHDSIGLASGIIYDRWTTYSKENFLRLNLLGGFGFKFFIRKKASTDINFTAGIGLNLIRKYYSEFYWLNSGGYADGDLVTEKKVIANNSNLNRPDIFIGPKITQYFKVTNVGFIFLSFLAGYNFDFYKYNKNGIYTSITLGLAISN